MDPEQINQQIAALQAQIDQAQQVRGQVDGDGDPTLAAIQAQKALPDLYAQLLNWTKLAQAAPATAKPTAVSPGDLDPTMPEIPVWDPASQTYIKVPNPIYDPDQAAQNQALRAAQLASAQRSAAGIGASTPRQPRWAEEEQLDQLQVQKAQQDLMDPYSLASQQRAEVLKTLTDQMSQGLIDETQANQTLKLWDDKTNASLQGTTPWAQETNRRTLAANNINDMYQAGTSLAPNLLSAALNMYKGILPNTGAPYGFNPLTETQNWQKGLNPAPELTDLSRGLLSGALGGQ